MKYNKLLIKTVTAYVSINLLSDYVVNDKYKSKSSELHANQFILTVFCEDSLKNKPITTKQNDINYNPYNCDEIACKEKAHLLFKALNITKDYKPNGSEIQSKASDDMKINEVSIDELSNKLEDNDDSSGLGGCPLDRSELGRSTWGLIHTIAAHYPDNPNDTDKTNVLNFVQSLAYLYPCKICAVDFQIYLKEHPPKINSRSDLILWFCELHNDVNDRLGKDQYPCSIDSLDERWKYGSKKCWSSYE